MNKQTTKGNKMHIISETTRPNGVKVTIGNSFCADEMVAYTVNVPIVLILVFIVVGAVQ